ncbi:hypothetical protein ACEQ8H_005655 [Pleosporales sp. CAS-2024a]
MTLQSDVLIHAGDLTNQGSLAELERIVSWLEKSEFEAKIVVAGNHDLTLDAPFFREHKDKWKWPGRQDAEACRRVLLEAPSITYLEHEAATLYLTGAGTCLKVFGSPYSPGRRTWAFQYWGDDKAESLWETREMDGADVVITHTPATRGNGGCGEVDADADSAVERAETLMVNAAFLSQRVAGQAPRFNKPIVIDVDLPLWRLDSEADSSVQ